WSSDVCSSDLRMTLYKHPNKLRFSVLSGYSGMNTAPLSHFQLAVLLGMTVALGPLALDAYLPAFPAIADELGVGHGGVGLTLSAYVGALGLAQLLAGPLSDRYGRQQILFFGLLVFAGAAYMVT